MSSPFSKIFALILMAALAVTSAFLPPPDGQLVSSVRLSVVLGIVSLAIMGLVLFASNGKVYIRKGADVMLPLFFFVMCLSDPGTVYFTEFSIVGVLLCCSLGLMTRFLITDKDNRKLFFISELFLASVIPVVPCMLWVYLLTSLTAISIKRVKKTSYLLIALAALLLPLIYAEAYVFFVRGEPLLSHSGEFSRSILDISPSFGVVNIVKLFYLLVIFLFLVRSVMFAITSRNSSLFVLGDYALHYWLWCWIFFWGIAVLYGLPTSDSKMFFGVMAIPFSMLTFNYAMRSKTDTGILFFAFLVAVTAYRISLIYL